LLVVVLPEGYQIGVPDPDLTPQRALATTCRTEAISCFDMQPVFAAAGGRLFLDVQHPNARGHALIGRAVAEALSSPAPPPGVAS
jgi:phospholipase/lecithinase/hemolysin